MNTHPPIPPNCSWFYLDDDGKRWFYIREKDTGDGYRVSCEVHCVGHNERSRCAAVARCAWLDAAANALAHRAVSQDAFGVHATTQDWLEAIMQAEAWRAWGESKD